MKILQITPYFYPSYRGQEVTAYELSMSLERLGHKVDVLTLNTEGVDKEGPLGQDIAVYRCDIAYRYHRAVVSSEFGRRMLRAKGYDLYHVHIPFHGGLEFAVIASRVHGIPIVANHHGQGDRGGRVYQLMVHSYDALLRNLTLRFLERVIFFSQSYFDSLALPRKVRDKARIVKPGIDRAVFSATVGSQALRERYGIGPEEKVVLFVGWLGSESLEHKGLAYLLQAMQRLQHETTPAKLLVVGSGDYSARIRELAGSMGLGKTVVFAGPATGHGLALHYSLCDLFVLPSTWESFGFVLLEAMASGKAIVASDIPGISDHIRHGETGWKVPPRDSEALAGAIAHLLRDDSLREGLARAAFNVSQEYSWERMARETADIYQEVLHR